MELVSFFSAPLAAALMVTAINVIFPFTGTLAQQADHPNRALQVYQDIISGRRSIESLSPEEQKMFFLVLRAMRHRSTKKSNTECRDALERAESAAEDVVSYGRQLISCVEAGDLRDDCSSEFQRLRSTHDDYEAAVSDVSSNCD